MSSQLNDEQRRGVRITVAVVTVIIAFIVVSFAYRVQQPRVMSLGEMKINGLYLLETPRNLGDFSLLDHRGESFDAASLEGGWTLIFFGFTHCPDVCPTTMAFLNQFLESLQGTEAEDTSVVMISVDPARDTVPVLAEYVPYFNPEFTGVTGEFLDVHRFATALNTPFRKVAGEGGNYQVDHSANVVLINPRGDYHGFFKAPLDLAKMKTTLRSAQVWWQR